MEKFVYIDGKKYKRGFTTGTCAVAAVKAALDGFFYGKIGNFVDVKLPIGQNVKLEIHQSRAKSLKLAYATIIKDGGDDIDATDGMEIRAKISLVEIKDFNPKSHYVKNYCDNLVMAIGAGKGIGIASRPGLKCQVGKPAINEIPRKMIFEEISYALDKYLKFMADKKLAAFNDVEKLDAFKDDESDSDKNKKAVFNDKVILAEISAPEGEEISLKTFNPKLGINGGISIIGTSGIVEPMSDDAWKKTLSIELEMLKNKGYEIAYLAPGNHGVNFFVNNLGLDESEIVKISNFVGYMLMECKRLGFKEICLVGHLGKLIKISAGIFNTHSRVADARMEILLANLALLAAPLDLLRKVKDTKTTDESIDLILESGYGEVYNIFSEKCAQRIKDHMRTEDIKVNVLIFSMDGRLLGEYIESEKLRGCGLD